MPDHQRLRPPLYRVFHLGPGNAIVRADVIDAPDDEAAILGARAMAADHACELWDRTRYVARVEPADPVQPIARRPLEAISTVEREP